MTEKATLFRLLEAETRTGMALTESFAMTPPAAVSGLYFAHPQAHYFRRRPASTATRSPDYARRKGWDLETAELLAGPDPGL